MGTADNDDTKDVKYAMKGPRKKEFTYLILFFLCL